MSQAEAINILLGAVSAIDAACAAVRVSGAPANTRDIEMLRFAQSVLRDIVARMEQEREG